MRHLFIGQRQKAPNFSAFHWSPHGCLITIGQHFVTTRVVHLPKRTETSLITESDQSRANHQLLQLCTARIAWSESDQTVRTVHSCKSWLLFFLSRKPGSRLCQVLVLFMLITVFSVYGGIYLDWDEIMLQPIDDLRKHDYVQVQEFEIYKSNRKKKLYTC